MKRLALAALALLLSCWQPAYAGPPLNSQENWVVAAFLSAPSTVVVDVVDVSAGTTDGDDLAATQVLIDGESSVFWRFDLSTVAGYPTGCTPKSYLVQFIPDSADCAEGQSPELCAAEYVQVGGAACLTVATTPEPNSEQFVHTSTLVTAQGIDQKVLNFYNARGVLPLLWIERDVSATFNYSAPDSTEWEVYFYTSAASAPRVKCTVVTDQNPSVGLPSSSHCL